MENLYDQLQTVENSNSQLTPKERLRAIERPLLAWYHRHARVLPWREEPTPYRVWISEIMLQQTRVEAVKPYFERFMEALPKVSDLAAVNEDRLLKLWEGLGYYNRARNLKKAALIIETEYKGELPASYEQLLKLPGIGSYTAGAIASIAYGLLVPAVDGNVLRVISRVLGSRDDILKQSVKRQMEEDLKQVIPGNNASAFNQGLIEIGAIICIPNGQPKCNECPLSSICIARREKLTDIIPVKTPKKPRKKEDRTVFLIEQQQKVAIEKRQAKGLLASLYQLPNVLGHIPANQVGQALGLSVEVIKSIQPLESSSHIFSHVEWNMIGYQVILKNNADICYPMVERSELLHKYPIPNAFKAYMKLIK